MITEEQGVLWDNDPHAVKRSEDSVKMVMNMTYDHLHSTGILADDPTAIEASKNFPMSYAEWLAGKS